MLNREITYERDINKSYMKIPAVAETGIDEKIMFKRMHQGMLPVEKCFVNGCAQYWYNISGKQALDAYCRVHSINQSFFENLLLRICNQLEVLEWNLMDTNCLIMEPELIFLNHSGEEISFVLYPGDKGNFLDGLQLLLEFLLSKLDHEDNQAVQQAYKIYDMVLKEGYSVKDLKHMILSDREVFTKPQEENHIIKTEDFAEIEKALVEERYEETEDIFQELERKLFSLFERLKNILWMKRENKEEIPMVVYPDEENLKEETIINPTICLAAVLGEPKGELIYEGREDYPNFELQQTAQILGKNPKVQLCINRDTISQFHAKFEYLDKKYYIEDLNSTNGTCVNDELLSYKEKRALSAGDVLRFADVKYRFL